MSQAEVRFSVHAGGTVGIAIYPGAASELGWKDKDRIAAKIGEADGTIVLSKASEGWVLYKDGSGHAHRLVISRRVPGIDHSTPLRSKGVSFEILGDTLTLTVPRAARTGASWPVAPIQIKRPFPRTTISPELVAQLGFTLRKSAVPELRAAAAEEGISVSELLRRLVEQYLVKREADDT